jgi:hypothetical protein
VTITEAPIEMIECTLLLRWLVAPVGTSPAVTTSRSNVDPLNLGVGGGLTRGFPGLLPFSLSSSLSVSPLLAVTRGYLLTLCLYAASLSLSSRVATTCARRRLGIAVSALIFLLNSRLRLETRYDGG